MAASTLPNGVRVLIQEKHDQPLVAIDLWVRAGSMYEQPGEGAAAHLLEHLLFRGAGKRTKAGETDFAIESAGGLLNAGTQRHAAHLYCTVPARSFPAALQAMTEALREPVLRDEDVAIEKRIVLHEIARRKNRWTDLVVDELFDRLYEGHPLSRTMAGTVASVGESDSASVQKFHKRQYRPENVTAVVVGDIDPDETTKAIEAALGNWTAAPAEKPKIPAPSPTVRDVSSEMTWAAPETAIVVGVRLPPVSDSKLAARAEVFAIALGDPDVGLLAQKLTSLKAIGSPWGGTTVSNEGGIVAVGLAGKAGDLALLKRVFDETIADLKRVPLKSNLIEAAKRRVRGRSQFARETVEGRARQIGEAEMRGGYLKHAEMLVEVDRITTEEMMEFAREIFGSANRVQLICKSGASK